MKTIYSLLCVFALGLINVSNVVAQNYCPGSDVIGSGYNVFGEYASTSSVKSPLFDLSKMNVKQMGDNKTYNIPDLLSLKYVNKKEYKVSEGRSLRDYARSINASAGMKYEGLLFEGSIETRFGSDFSSTSSNYFFTIRDLIWIWKVGIDETKKYDLKKYLKADAKNAIDTWPIDRLFNVYGTHFVAAGYFGGAMDYNLSERVSTTEERKSVSATVEAKRKSLSGNVSSSVNTGQVNSNFAKNIKIQACGGDVQYVNKTSANNNNQYNLWVGSVPSQSVLVDFAEDGLMPIWDLASTTARKNKIKSAFLRKLKSHPLPEANASFMLTQDQVFYIRPLNNTSKYWDIPGYGYNAKTDGATLELYIKDNVDNGLQGPDRFIKFIPHPTRDGLVYIQPQHSDYVLTVEKRKSSSGSSSSASVSRSGSASATAAGGSGSSYALVLKKKSKTNNSQLFKLMEDKEENTYKIQTADGKLFVMDTGSKTVGLGKKSNSSKQVWYLEAANPRTQMSYLPVTVISLENVANHRYIDVPGGPGHQQGRGGKLQLWDMHRQVDRYFEMTQSKGTKGVFSLSPLHGPWVFDIAGGSKSKNAALQLWDKNGSSAQYFRFVYAGAPLTFYIENVNSGLRIQADQGQIHGNGSKLTQQSASAADNQKWKVHMDFEKVIPPSNQSFYIKCARSNKYMDLPGDGNANTNQRGMDYQIWDLGNPNEGDRKFKFSRAGGKWCTIKAQNGGRRVDVDGGVGDEGKAIQIWDANNGNAQKFMIMPLGADKFMMVTRFGKAWDVVGGVNNNGNKVKQYNAHGKDNQQFQLIYADGPKKGQVYRFW